MLHSSLDVSLEQTEDLLENYLVLIFTNGCASVLRT